MASPLLLPDSLAASPCQSDLDPKTAADYEAYLKTARAAAEQPIGPNLVDRIPVGKRAEALATLDNQPYAWNVEAGSPNGALPVYKGVIVDWIGAMRIPGTSLDAFMSVLQNYDSYKKWYKPYIYDCYARPIDGPGVKNYAVTTIVHDVYEKPAMLVPDQNFSFEIQAESNYFLLDSGDARTLVIRTHSKAIRESNTGRPERADSRTKNDLVRPEHGQGVLWRSDTWWRATSTGRDLYAEYESLSLARSLEGLDFFSVCSVLRLPGVKDKALESMTVRPRRTVLSVMTSTKSACATVRP
jgi:hypothetical protein